MAEWKNAIITNKGTALLSKLISGDVLSIVRAVSGSGYVDPATLCIQTDVANQKQELTFATQSYPEEGKCALPVKLTNSGVKEEYTAKQIGVYAFDPDEGEILFLISQAEKAEEGKGTDVPAESDIPGFSASWEFFIQYGQADGVEVTVDPSNTVNHAEAEAIVDTHDKSQNPHEGVLAKVSDLSNHTSAQNNPHNVTAAQLGLDKVSNTPDSEKYVKYASTAGTADKVKYSIIVRFNGGRTEGTNMWTFDGSTSRSVNITADKIGAAEKDHSHTAADVGAVPTTGGTMTGDLTFDGGNIILKKGVNWFDKDDELPAPGIPGRLLFKVVD